MDDSLALSSFIGAVIVLFPIIVAVLLAVTWLLTRRGKAL